MAKIIIGLMIALIIISSMKANALDLSMFSLKRIMGNAGIDYEVEITGIEEPTLETSKLKEIAIEAIDEANPPQDIDELTAVSGLMAARVTDFLNAEGYYDANTRSEVVARSEVLPLSEVKTDEKANSNPIVRLDIRLARQYMFANHQIIWEDAPTKATDLARNFPKTIIRNGLIIGAPINNSATLNTALDIQERLMRGRCYLDLQVTPTLVLDRLNSQAEVLFKVKHTGEANFGKTQFSGKTDINDAILHNYVTWREGECFNKQKIDTTTSQMLQSRLLARVDIEPQLSEIKKNANDNGETKTNEATTNNVPINIDVTDRPHRTFTAGGYYATDEGVGTRLGWEHRNLYGMAHRLTTKLTLTGREKSGVGQYTIPFFLNPNQNLQLSASAKNEKTNAFDSTNISSLVALERYIINPQWLVGAGAGLRIAKINDVRGTQDFALVYAPIFMQWDSRNDLFDATSGVFTRGSISPYIDAKGGGVSFIKSEISSNLYFNINDIYATNSDAPHDAPHDTINNLIDEADETVEEWLPYSPIIAIRGVYGQINGAARSDVPADLRFYAGGGGSVRGYNFQAIGEREAGLPAGGTVKTEINAELRLRFNPQFGGVLFMDAGNVYQGNVFNAGEKLYFSAGAGVRYFSPIGPLRFDIGVPLDDVADKTNFGVYISIGQAF